MITAAQALAAHRATPQKTPGRPDTLDATDRLAAMAAVAEARRRYPAAVADVLADAVDGYVRFGFRFDFKSRVPRLIRELTA